LCLRLLQQADVKSRRVVDVGTGSGVLALAAWKLGADDITAIDRDADALRNARDNIARNGASAAIDLRHADLGNVSLAPADIVLANLTGAALCRHAPDLRALTKPSGALIASGFSASEADTVTSALGGAVRLQVTENDWTALLIDR
jgi:ribosomal protein L11 methyltransferase